ncbi:MAG: aconitate hydratase, partial [Spirochaetota bacterium]
LTAIAGGLSYGQGSSREHAAICPMYLGVRLVAAKSFERIHSANLINFGILPATFADEADYDAVAQGASFEVKGLRSAIEKGSDFVIMNVEGKEIKLVFSISQRQREILLEGGLLNYTKKKMK